MDADTMNHFEFVFIVLVYRNTDDLKEFFRYLRVPDSKVIVVNSYYDEYTDKVFQKIAEDNNAQYLRVENKGYGAGNNVGIKFALDNYLFEWLIVSNADITIGKFGKEVLNSYKNFIIAPKIITKHGKNQNPSTPFSPLKFIDKLLFKTYRGNHRKIVWLFYAWSRMTKIIYYTIQRIRPQIFAPHGAFIIIPRKVLQKLFPLFNEKMFLFNEETHLGKLAEKNNVGIMYSPGIIINHKEDGSVSLLNESIFKLSRDSFLEYYKYWYE